MLKFARSSRLLPATGVANHSKPGWRSRVVELTTLVGYLAKFVDPSASHAWSGLSWSEDLGHLLMYVLDTMRHDTTCTREIAHICSPHREHTNEPTVKKFITLVGSAMSSPSMHATASGSFAFRFFTSLRQRLLGADDQPQQEFKNLLAALGSLPPSMATIGVRSSQARLCHKLRREWWHCLMSE
jgi:hypothetical protein